EQLLLSPGDVEDIGEDFTVPVDRARIDETVEKALHRIPIVEKARIAGGWAGLRPLTPDDHAIIGWAPGLEGFFLAVGFGGHGFQHSPDRKSTRLNSSHQIISYAVFCLKKK